MMCDEQNCTILESLFFSTMGMETKKIYATYLDFLFSRLPYYNSRCVIGIFWSHSNFKRLNFRLYTNDVKSPFGILRAYCRKTTDTKTKSGMYSAASITRSLSIRNSRLINNKEVKVHLVTPTIFG